MPGQFSPPATLANGSVYSAEVHNASWQAIYNNLTAYGVDDASGTVTDMQTTTDPGETGTESLSTNMAGELRRLRFAIAEMRNSQYWYNSTSGRELQLAFHVLDENSVPKRHRLIDGVTNTVIAKWYVNAAQLVPATGDLIFSITCQTATTGNTMVLTYALIRHRIGAADSTLTSGNANLSPSVTSMLYHQILTYNNAGGGVVAGDVLELQVSRIGADAGDTNTGSLNVWTVQMVGIFYAGRP